LIIITFWLRANCGDGGNKMETAFGEHAEEDNKVSITNNWLSNQQKATPLLAIRILVINSDRGVVVCSTCTLPTLLQPIREVCQPARSFVLSSWNDTL
jgi:hypothetical protein